MLHMHSKQCYNLAQDRNKKVVRLHQDEYTVLYIRVIKLIFKLSIIFMRWSVVLTNLNRHPLCRPTQRPRLVSEVKWLMVFVVEDREKD